MQYLREAHKAAHCFNFKKKKILIKAGLESLFIKVLMKPNLDRCVTTLE